jgi:hypothetical protein
VRPFVGQVGVGYLGKQVRNAGMDTDSAMEAMMSGRWDPYADVAIPVPDKAAEAPTEPYGER